jgi:hypothetical protein
MTEQWYIEHEDGSIEQVYSDTKPHPNARKIDRFGDLAIERHHARKGWTPRETEHLHAAIDAGHQANHGPWRLLIDHAAKEIEARVILGTLALDGRVAREAEARGIEIEELAHQIVAQADAANVERDRVAAKLAATK